MSKPVQLAVGALSRRAIYKPEHQACEPVDQRPRYWYLNPLQPPVGVWAGSQQYVDFELDQQIGVCKSLNLRLDLGAFTDNTHLPNLPPTPYWLSRVEVYLGADLVETVYADSVWHETVAFLREQAAHDIANVYNINESDLSPIRRYTQDSYAAAVAGTGATAADPVSGSAGANGPGFTPSGYYYISLDATCIKACKPYVRGFESKWKVRIYFPTTLSSQLLQNTAYIPANPSATPPTAAVPATFYPSQPTLASIQLIAEEEQTDPATIAKLEQAHKAGVIDYTALVRERLQDNPPNYIAGQNTTTYLRAFRNKSAGLIVYLTQPNASNDALTQRMAFTSAQLLDSRGNKITEILDVDFLTSRIFPAQIDSSFINAASPDMRTITLFPFAAEFQPVIERGCDYGKFQLTSLEQLVIVPVGTPGTRLPNGEMSSATGGSNLTMLTVVSYSYAHITCVGGKHSIRFEV